jgi:hypothetical protein
MFDIKHSWKLENSALKKLVENEKIHPAEKKHLQRTIS